jgi:hypothetical protein
MIHLNIGHLKNYSIGHTLVDMPGEFLLATQEGDHYDYYFIYLLNRIGTGCMAGVSGR